MTSAMRLFARFLRQLGLADALFQLVHLVAAFFAFAEFLLDRLELLVEIIFALGLLHLALDPRADLALDLQHADFAPRSADSTFSSRSVVDSVSSSAWRSEILTDRCAATVSASRAGSSIWATAASVSDGIFLLSLMYCSKLVLTVRSSASVSRAGGASSAIFSIIGLEEIGAVGEAGDAGAPLPSTSTRTVWSGSFRSCSTVARVPMVCRPSARGIVFRRDLLGQQQDLLFLVHHLFQGAHGFLAAHEQGNDHVGKHHNIAQRQNRRDVVARLRLFSLCSRTSSAILMLLPASPPA